MDLWNKREKTEPYIYPLTEWISWTLSCGTKSNPSQLKATPKPCRPYHFPCEGSRLMTPIIYSDSVTPGLREKRIRKTGFRPPVRVLCAGG
ncbi:hypothetical protein CDAR_540541 [Caerostris darwini]|uniref:Uncharacterized protein n=1 Tax=Caerostris darwini TaxID=1538125 RepID=A0AAV4VLK4_9ARAC|nr:hypothetical protein CDAR_540541 [Caerostris darwini]